jgi:transposase-like protein
MPTARDARSRPRVGDGALGFWKALAEVFPETRHQRCWVHKIANVANALPKSTQPGAKKALQALKAVAAFAKSYGAKFPKAVKKITDDVDELLAFYDFPAEHWIHLRTTNPIESTFATVRLRTKVTRGAGSAAAALAMVRVRPGPLAGRELTSPRRRRPRRSPLRTRTAHRAHAAPLGMTTLLSLSSCPTWAKIRLLGVTKATTS